MHDGFSMAGEPIRSNRSKSSAKGPVYYAIAGEPYAACNGTRFPHPAGKPLHPKIMRDPDPMSLLSSFSSSGSTRPVSGSNSLDNPIWHALVTEQSSLALGSGLARRFPAEIGPLCGMEDTSAASYEALRTLASPGEMLRCSLRSRQRPGRLDYGTLRHSRSDDLFGTRDQESLHVAREPKFRRLTPNDVPAMLELATLTEPGHSITAPSNLGILRIFDSEAC